MLKNYRPQLRLIFDQLGRHRRNLPDLSSQKTCDDYMRSLCKQNLHREALEVFELLEDNTDFRITPSTYAHLICACSSLRSLGHGKRIHEHILMSKCHVDLILQNHILNMYGKCGSLKDAIEVFDAMPQRNVVSWTSMISGYSQNGRDDDAIKLYFQMLRSGHRPDQFTFGSIIKACSGMDDACLGSQLHSHIIKSQSGYHLIPQNALIAMYTKFGQIKDAYKVFSYIRSKDLISWGSMIAGFSQLGYELEALHHFKEILCQDAYQPNEFIFGSVFSACSCLLQPEYGKQMHGICIKFGLGRNIFAGCSLCDMYGKCGLLESAKRVFYNIDRPDLVSWNAIISGCANSGDVNEAISFFTQARGMGLVPNDVTLLSLLSACTSPLAVHQGRQVHSYLIKMGFDLNIPVCNTLLSMYAKCSVLFDAFKVFEDIRNAADSVSWNAIMSACMQHNQPGDVFRLMKLMLISTIKPDHVTLSNAVAACAEIASEEVGNQVHCFSVKSGLVSNVSVINSLIDMYTKCGSLENAQKLFDLMENPDVVSWSSLIMGYAQFGYGEKAIQLFIMMRGLGVKPNEVTFVGVLTACSHIGMIEEGWQIYRTMENKYGIVPTKEHCSCMVDLLARAGFLNEAEDFIQQMEFDPDIVVWKTLLAACKTHGNVELAKQAAENIIKIDPFNSAAHVLLCSIYASSGCWGDVARLRNFMKERGVMKVPGQSWIEVKGNFHVFLAEDTLHPERGKIYEMLEELWLQTLDDGCDLFQA
ncbi:pentatricopeptide repeat-containing protein At3g53360, mitochondrial isoform X1 [Ziziphus jujuba]|uniref:Pentatricopeptide repeat-containing protein At3g53360, mitochondrial isoform X1 n=1 Tax=Ziziphus jujuba TaxID=326968 RepID=A0ABM3ZX16_ZIZJJ|nr:pentatricopeptide repeat-containing protein At3g53360, mitochondrial isoform X1 [Ziziphus jujuba]XP_060669019.1 pentatricopeptide repeat-containing protein At3g53360, mitochondrial isoform X1 [Ziziphus jujuba]XP_060669020.1 pentatricopeptide repeat-containing protein At3g53360, mitochondrial isoform X1 [Ziziphus jujuba]XP_060669021.1 pentatricopeptide repeat-containing protein At3g53360, mitochondrial isoform X1 [Ziziphus jujuba]